MSTQVVYVTRLAIHFLMMIDHCDEEFHELDRFVEGSWILALKSIMMLVVPERVGLMTLASISDLSAHYFS